MAFTTSFTNFAENEWVISANVRCMPKHHLKTRSSTRSIKRGAERRVVASAGEGVSITSKPGNGVASTLTRLLAGRAARRSRRCCRVFHYAAFAMIFSIGKGIWHSHRVNGG